MKKIFAIMMIAVIAVAGVFAVDVTGPTALKLNYEIIERFVPAYTFKLGNDEGDVFDMGNNTTGDNHANRGFVETTSDAFQIIDRTYANINALNNDSEAGSHVSPRTLKITLDASDSKWTLTQSDFTYVSDSEITIENYAVIDDGNHTFANSDGYTVNAVATPNGQSTVANSVTVSYARGLINRADNNVAIASFKVKWTVDSEAPAGDYTATIAVGLEAL